MSEEIKEPVAEEQEEVPAEAPEATAAETTPAPAKKKRKWPIIVGVVALVVVAAGAGFWVWHEQPSFCSAICHTPMDPYLATYNAEPGTSTTDKYGNEVSDASGMMASLHRTEGGTTCLDCHVPTLSEQISEGISWVGGTYAVYENDTYGLVLAERAAEDLVAARGLSDDEFCMNESCHTNADGSAMTRDDLAALTADLEFNPHVSEHGVTACTDCHKAHRASVLVCATCHPKASLPDGWITAAQEKKLTIPEE